MNPNKEDAPGFRKEKNRRVGGLHQNGVVLLAELDGELVGETGFLA